MRSRMFRIFLPLWCSLLVFSNEAWCGEKTKPKDFEVYELGEIVVTAKRPAVNDVAIAHEITTEDFKATGSHTVAEALSHVPGIRVSTGRKNEPAVSIHGFSQHQVLILIDGVPYYETKYGKLDMNQIPTDIVAKIEIVKGAPSALYGPNAEVGVINIVTKKAAEKPLLSAKIELGEKETMQVSASNGMKIGTLSYWLNYTHRESDGWKMSGDFTPKQGTIVRRPSTTAQAVLEDGGFRNNSDYRSDSFWLKFGIEPGEGSEYYVNCHYIDSEKGIPPSVTQETVFLNRPAFSGFSRFANYDDWGIDLSGRERILDQLTLKGKLFYHHHLDDYVSYSDQTYSTEIASSRFKDYLAGVSLFADLQAADWNVLRMAAHYKGDSHQDRDDTYLPFAEAFSYTGSIALENELLPSKDLSVVAGVSYDWFEIDKAQKNVTSSTTGDFIRQDNLTIPGTKSEINPSLGAAYTFADSTRLFGSVARKTRFPTLDQLYSSRSGNPELEAEDSVNYTLGASRPFLKVSQVGLALFHHDISDLISRDAPGVTGNYRNYSKIRMYGIDLDLAVCPLDNLTVNLAYTYNHANDQSEGRVTDHVVNVPEHKADLGLKYTLPATGTHFDINGLYMAATYSQLPTPQSPSLAELKTDEYLIWGGRISQEFLRYFEAYLAVKNIFDENYEPESGYPGPGRQFWIGLTGRY